MLEPDIERTGDPFQGPQPTVESRPSSAPAANPLRIRTTVDGLAGWIKGRQPVFLILAAVAQILFLVGMTFPRATTVLTADTIFLRVVPVDPRDLFRGDYVTLSYEISRVPPGGIDDMAGSGMDPNDDRWKGRAVYVGLEPEEDNLHYRGTEVHFTPPPSGRYIRGILDSRFRITFGIESYYVQEGRGKTYEKAVLDHKLSAVVALDSDGTAQLKGVSIEGNSPPEE